MMVSAGVLLGPFITWGELAELRELADESPETTPFAIAAAVVLGLLLLWNVAAIAAIALRRPQARGMLLAYFGARAFVSTLAALASPAGGFLPWWPTLINLLLFFYVGWSADAIALLGPSGGTVSATESLADDPM